MNNNELFEEALDHVDGKQIHEAATPIKKRRAIRWIASVAAVLAVVIAARSLLNPLTLLAQAVSAADYPEYQWVYRRELREQTVPLQTFWQESIAQTLSGQKENAVFSPINLSMGLSITAELTDGNTRQQILDALNMDSMEQTRSLFHEIWLGTYLDDGNQTLLANSLWLDEQLSYRQDTMDLLAQEYYTSVYRADLDQAGSAIGSWLNQQTGNLLKQDTAQIQLPEEAVLALYATIYYQAKWGDDFNASLNTEGLFHGTQGDTVCTYMNAKLRKMDYYWGEDFGAVGLGLKDGSTMWLILPDEDKTVDDVLSAGEYYNMFSTGYSWENSKYVKVNLSIPKFDIRQSSDLKPTLVNMGITDAFSYPIGDFSNAVSDSQPVYLTGVNQATRVAIDEKGVTAASYIEFPGAGEAAPPEEIVDFILNRPFLFVITNRYGIPLFAGVVNMP